MSIVQPLKTKRGLPTASIADDIAFKRRRLNRDSGNASFASREHTATSHNDESITSNGNRHAGASDTSATATQTQQRRRGRQSKQAKQVNDTTIQADTTEGVGSGRRSGKRARQSRRPQLEESPVSEEEQEVATNVDEAEITGETTGNERRRRNRGRSSRQHEVTEQHDSTHALLNDITTTTNSSAAAPTESSGSVVARTQVISRATIRSKWTPLPSSSISAISSILDDAARPVLVRIANEQRRAAATSALQAVTARLQSKMAKGMSFPPPCTKGVVKAGRKHSAAAITASLTSSARFPSGSAAALRGAVIGNNQRNGVGAAAATADIRRQGELMYESVIDAVRDAHARLTPLTHSVTLLRREKERQKTLLKQEHEALKRFEKNARDQRRTWAQQLKKGHELLPPPGVCSPTAGRASREGWVGDIVLGAVDDDGVGGGCAAAVFKDMDDDEILELAQKMANHVESIAGNLKQVEGVQPAIDRARAALQGVLCKYLDAKEFEDVLLGPQTS